MTEQKTRITRKNAQSMSEIVDEFIKAMKISSSLNNRRIFEAWIKASGCGKYTLRQFFRDGTLHVSLSSSTVRSSLSFQLEGLVEKINSILLEDPLFTKDDPKVSLVEKIVLK